MRHEVTIGRDVAGFVAALDHVAEEVAPLKPCGIPERPVAMRLSGLEPLGNR